MIFSNALRDAVTSLKTTKGSYFDLIIENAPAECTSQPQRLHAILESLRRETFLDIFKTLSFPGPIVKMFDELVVFSSMWRVYGDAYPQATPRILERSFFQFFHFPENEAAKLKKIEKLL
ncbi:unnamed protein product [Haemonchus placei]|uniref:NR LBD domain-containing protein n=1 Tax=Haemonchus placei TaxID=6290 RepID=A0A0N4VVN2_HAEPC|nr:unnamed protein product [Haemonchus placei]